jgi:hypothetical protein
MPSTERSTNDQNNTVQIPAEMLDRLVVALERLGTSQNLEAAAEFRNALATETNAAIARWQSEALVALADRINAPPSFGRHHGRELNLAQQQLILRYDAFRTALGRTGAAAIVFGVVSQLEDLIAIVQGSVPDVPLTLVAYGTTGAEIGRGQLSRESAGEPRQAVIPNLRDKQLARFELWDQAGRPILFGLVQDSGGIFFTRPRK